MKLRTYQSKSVTDLYQWFENNETGNPVLNLPGGSGKSVIIAAIVKDALMNWPSTRVLMLVHVKELLSQNAEKIRTIWPNAPMGIYSASLNRRCATEPITYAGIGSVAKRAKEIGHIDICIIDEAHSISNDDEGQYRKLIKELMEINPNMRCVGLTASPYRIGQGLLTEGENSIFNDIIEPVTIEDLLNDGYLAPLRSKHTSLTLSTEGVKKSKGDFIMSQLEKAVDTDDNNTRCVDEIIARSEGCKTWMVFCTGISHANHINDLLKSRCVKSEVVHGGITRKERDDRIEWHKSGKVTALVSVGILTTGYDNPLVDLLAFLRPTGSPGLYAQMAFRGTRPVYAKGFDLENKDQRFKAMAAGPKPNGCRVLDFAGIVAEHGPITAIVPPRRGRKGEGTAPTKVCPQCDETLSANARTCTCCGHEFPPPEKVDKPVYLRGDDIMGIEPTEMPVKSWTWAKHVSRSSGNTMLMVKYYGKQIGKAPIAEYLPVQNEGFAGHKARTMLATLASKTGATMTDDLDDMADAMNQAKPPSAILHKRDGKFFRVIDRIFA